MDLTTFRALGRSGLIVSPIALGTMTFGTPHWGASDEISESIFHTYIDADGKSWHLRRHDGSRLALVIASVSRYTDLFKSSVHNIDSL